MRLCGKRHVLWLAAIAMAVLPAPSLADPPTTKRLVGTLISPTTAFSWYDTFGTTHTNGLAFSSARASEIKALARSLSQAGALMGDAFAQRVADYVRKNIEVEFRFGLGKGARGAAIDQSGTPFDQAQLMVEVLREGGQAASYQLGTITLNADQFGKWTGLVTGLSQGGQTFTVDAQAACQMLADGGIPATVNGATTCVGLTGNLSTVTMGHIWVSTNGKLYDPAFKVNILKTGIDIPAAMGCGSASSPTCGATATQSLLTGATSGIQAGVPYFQSLNETTHAATLQSFAANTQQYLESNAPLGPLEDVAGGAIIDLKYTPVISTSLPYPSSVTLSWTAEIPDQYRTFLAIDVIGGTAKLFADEVYGKRIRVYFQNDGSSASYRLYTENTQITLSSGSAYTPAPSSPFPGKMTANLGVSHPYAANSGLYGDRSYQQAYLETTGQFSIIFALGNTGSELATHFAALQAASPRPNPSSSMNCDNSPSTESSCSDNGQSSLGARYLVQQSAAANLVAALGKAKAMQHHIIGVSFSTLPFPTGDPNNIGVAQRILSSQTSLSIAGPTGGVISANEAFRAVALISAALEGSVVQQDQSAWETMSAPAAMVLANRKAQKLFDAPPSAMAGLVPNLTNYTSDRIQSLNNLASLGFSVILPQSGFPGCFTFTAGGICFWGGGEYAYTADNVASLISESFKGGSAGYSRDPTRGVLSSVDLSSTITRRKSDFNADLASGDVALRLRPDLQTGPADSPTSLQFRRSYLSGAPTAEMFNTVWQLVAGPTGSIPSPITTVQYNGPDQGSYSRLGGGWGHNYQISGSLVSSVDRIFGQDGAVDASMAISSLFTVLDALRANSTEARLAGNFSAYWMSRQIVDNLIAVRGLDKASSFQRLPNGRFAGLAGSDSVLTLQGARGAVFLACNAEWSSYDQITFSVTTGDGSQTDFVNGSKHAQLCGNLSLQVSTNGFVPVKMVDPSGISQNLTYVEKGVSQGNDSITRTISLQKILSAVNNSAGRALNFTNIVGNLSDCNQSPLPPTCPSNSVVAISAYSLSSVSDENGRSIGYSKSSCAPYFAVGVSAPTLTDFSCARYIMTNTQGVSENYDYAPDGFSPNPADLTRVPYRLRRWILPNSTTPYLQFSYDELLKVKQAKDRKDQTSAYFVSGYGGKDAYRVGERADPLGLVNATTFDRNAQTVTAVDPIGRTVSSVYDSSRRLLRTVLAEGNAVEYQYDVRGNKTRECAIPKGAVSWSGLTVLTEQAPQCNTSRAPVADLATVTAYVEAPTLRADQCVNMKTCNKPAYVIDPKGNRTSYTWSGTHGQLLTETSGLNAAGACALAGGVCPVTTYGYSSFTGSDGAVFYLLTSKQETISSGVTTTTTYEYDTASKFVLKSSVVDSGGLSLRTCYKFDPAGNLISKTEPKALLTVCP